MRTDQPERFLFLFSSNFRVFLLTLFLNFLSYSILDSNIERRTSFFAKKRVSCVAR
jgi:hypothetical protein